MKTEVLPSAVAGTVRAITSKSYAHRLLIAAALGDTPCEVVCRDLSEDIDATLRCIVALGAVADKTERGFLVTPVPRENAAKECVLDCGESGSTLRFMLPVACALGRKAEFTGRGRLPDRPIGGLADCLKAHGITFSADRLPFSTEGKLECGVYDVPAGVSSQYVSGMLRALSCLHGNSLLRTQGKRVSQGYLNITLDVLSRFGAEVCDDDEAFRITGGLHSPSTVVAEGDWSNAAFLLAAGALAGDVTVTGLDPDSKQADKRIYDLLMTAGADVSKDGDAFRARKSALSPFRADLSDIPDLAPVLSVLAGAANGVSVFTGAARLREKESDRLAAVMSNLAAMGVRSEYDETEDALRIYGGKISPFKARSFNDHRMVMSAAVAGLVAGGTIDNIAPVKKSYPDFFEVLNALGGKTNETV